MELREDGFEDEASDAGAGRVGDLLEVCVKAGRGEGGEDGVGAGRVEGRSDVSAEGCEDGVGDVADGAWCRDA